MDNHEHDPGLMYCDASGPGWTSLYVECEHCGQSGSVEFKDSQVVWNEDESCTHAPDNVYCSTADSMGSCMSVECHYCDASGYVNIPHSKVSWDE